ARPGRRRAGDGRHRPPPQPERAHGTPAATGVVRSHRSRHSGPGRRMGGAGRSPVSGAIRAFAAVDLGASSGRVVLGRVSPGSLDVEEVHRFANQPVTVRGTLHWDILGLYRETLVGLRRAAERAELTSIGIDSWAVDYGLLDDDGGLIANPVHYRDARTA